MSDLVGNLEDNFSYDTAHNYNLFSFQTAFEISSHHTEVVCSQFDDRTFIIVTQYNKIGTLVRPEFFYFCFTDPPDPIFLEIEKKQKKIFFNFIFLFPSDSCQYSTVVQLCFFVLSFLLQPG